MLLPSGPAAAEEALRDPAALHAPAPGCLTPPHLLDIAVPGNLRRTAGPASGPGPASRKPAARRPVVPPQPPVMWEPPPLRLAIHSCLLTEAPTPRGMQPRRT
jgi:hypothetical protein